MSVLNTASESALKTLQIPNTEERVILEGLARAAAKPGCMLLEIGSWCGDSAVVLGKIARERNGKLFCVDWWKGSLGTDLYEIAATKDIFSVFWERICSEGLEDVVVPIRAKSSAAAAVLRARAFDLVFIDGDHRYESVLADIELYKPLVRAGGILCGHDCEGRPADFDPDFLEEGRNLDYHQSVHCGVVLAVRSQFRDYSLNYSIWSVRNRGAEWEPAALVFPGIDNAKRQVPPPPFAFTENYRLYRLEKRVFGVPVSFGELDLTQPEACQRDGIVSAESTAVLLESLGEQILSRKYPELVESIDSYNIVRFGKTYFALPQAFGPVDLTQPEERLRPEIFSGPSLEALVACVRAAAKPTPRLISTYGTFNIVRYGDLVYGLARDLGPVDFHATSPERFEDLARHGQCVVGKSIEDVCRTLEANSHRDLYQSLDARMVELSRSINRELNERVRSLEDQLTAKDRLIETVKRDFAHASRQAERAGAALQQKLEQRAASLEQQLHESASRFQALADEKRRLIDVLEKSARDYAHMAQALHDQDQAKIATLEQDLQKVRERLNFAEVAAEAKDRELRARAADVDDLQRRLAVKEEETEALRRDAQEKTAALETLNGLLGQLEGKTQALSRELERIRRTPLNRLTERLHGLRAKFNAGFLDVRGNGAVVRTVGSWNIILQGSNYHAVPQRLGPVDFGALTDAQRDQILTAPDLESLTSAVRQVEMRTAIEYGGWLPVFSTFGGCGSHPQFAHIDRPPTGYRFVRSTANLADPRNSRAAWRNTASRLARALSAGAAFAGLAARAALNGASPRALLDFFKSRDWRSQLLLPGRVNLLFLTSVPYTFGQHDWVIEIEDTTSMMFPFVHNGSTSKLDVVSTPIYPILKALLESPRCKGIITHVRSTAESIPRLFRSEALRKKVTYAPLGVRLPELETRAPGKDVQLLFTNSWHQNPASFFLRGGLDVLEAFRALEKEGCPVRLTLRTKIPDAVASRYQDVLASPRVEIISEFMEKSRWHGLLNKADILMLPADRIHVVSVLEAMGFGIVPFVSDGWGFEEYVRNGENGLVARGRYGRVTWMDTTEGVLREDYAPMHSVEPVIVRQLIDEIRRLAADRRALAELQAAARKSAETDFSLDSWNGALKKAFDKALAPAK